MILSENGRGSSHFFSFFHFVLLEDDQLKCCDFAGMDNPGNWTRAKVLHDTTRIKFYKSYMIQLKKAVDEGANVLGYFAWSLLDNFEWRLGYTSRFGIVYVDFKTLERYPKMSAYWFKKLLTKTKH